ncbi:hypothetical protein, partial [Megasphaera massiliensis]|uniref:hypothetical protein n=1 Tax=Megasphaera massiliensis TaxID=1232428 RepID=UPI001E5D2E36
MSLSKLIMKKEGLSDLPGFHCPTGYQLRHFQPDDERNWEDLIRYSFTREVKFADKIGDHAPFIRIAYCSFAGGISLSRPQQLGKGLTGKTSAGICTWWAYCPSIQVKVSAL